MILHFIGPTSLGVLLSRCPRTLTGSTPWMFIFCCPCESSLSIWTSIPSTANSLQFAWGIAESSTWKFEFPKMKVPHFLTKMVLFGSMFSLSIAKQLIVEPVGAEPKEPLITISHQNGKMLPSRVATWAIRSLKFAKLNGIASGLYRGQRTRYLSPTGTALWRRLFVEEEATREGRRNGVVGPGIRIFDKLSCLHDMTFISRLCSDRLKSYYFYQKFSDLITDHFYRTLLIFYLQQHETLPVPSFPNLRWCRIS